MWYVWVCAAVACCAAWLAARWAAVRRYWAERGVPHRAPHPLWGSLAFLQKQNPAIWMKNMYREMQAPYIGIWLFWRPALVINSPEIARNVLVKDFDVFRDRFISKGQKDHIGGFSLFTVNDPIWTAVRRRLTQVFTAAKLRMLQALLNTKVNELVQRIQREVHDSLCQQRKPIDMRSIYSDYTSDIIGTAAFGVKTDATLTGKDVIREVTKDLMSYSVWRGLSWSSIFFFPELVDIFRFTLFPQGATAFFRNIFRNVVTQRGGYDKDPGDIRDLLDALLKMRCESAKTGDVMSEDMLLAQAITFLQAGTESTSTAFTFATYELAFHPVVQERMYRELHEARQRSGEGKLDAAVLAELPYFNAVIKETLRKYTSMGWLARIASADYQIDDKLTITKGTPLYVNAVGMHYDPEYFPEPDKFDPDRFLPENEKNIKPFTYMPFGQGPRNCIGMRFAYNTVRQGLAAAALRYEFRPLPGACEPNCCELEKKGLFVAPEKPLYVEFVARDKSSVEIH